MNGLERDNADDRAYLAAATVGGLMCDLLWDESHLHGDRETREDSLAHVLELVAHMSTCETAEIPEALEEATKVIMSEIDSAQAEAWLDLCVELACKSVASALGDDKKIAYSTANECIGTCIEAIRALDIYDQNLCKALNLCRYDPLRPVVSKYP